MATESINEIVSKEAIDQILNLGTQLETTKSKMTDLLTETERLKKELQTSNSFKEAATGAKTLYETTERLNQTNKNSSVLQDKLMKERQKLSDLNKKDAEEKAKLNLMYQKQNQALKQNTREALANENTIEKQRATVARLKREWANADIGSKKFKELEKDLRKATKELEGSEKKAGIFSRGVGAYGKNIVSSFKSMALGVASLGAAIGLLKNASKTIADFEQANANLSTILGKTRDEITELTNSAKQLGATTEWTASQVTELQTELAKLGYGEQEIMNMQASVLQFSTATGANLAEAAALAGSTLRAFGMTTEETERAVSVMTLGTTKSALSFSYLQSAMSTIAPVANSFGFSIEDTTALLGTLANAGFNASSAATATRNILLNLADANGDLAKELGGSVKTIPELSAALIKLRDSGIDLAGTLELTDKRSVAAFNTFLQGAEKLEGLRTELDNTDGVLDKIQKERLNTLQGSVKLMNSAWEGLMLSFSKSNGVVRVVVDGMTGLLNGINKLVGDSEKLISVYEREIETFLDLEEKTSSLMGEYEILTTKTELNADEQERLKDITQELAEAYPGAITKLDEYGKALGINTDKIYEYIEAEKERLKYINKSAIEETEDAIKKTQAQIQRLRTEATATMKEVLTADAFGNSVWKTVEKSASEIAEANKRAMEQLPALQSQLKGQQAELNRLNGNMMAEGQQRRIFNKMASEELQEWINDVKNVNSEYRSLAKEILAAKTVENGAGGGGDNPAGLSDSQKKQLQKESEQRLKYISDVEQKRLELEAKTDEEILNTKLKRLEKQRDEEIKSNKLTAKGREDELRKVNEYYALQAENLQKEAKRKQIENERKAIVEIIKTTETLNKYRKENSEITNEQLTEILIEQQKKRFKIEFENLKSEKEKELELLEENTEIYLLAVEKWKLREQELELSNSSKITEIRKKGFDDVLKENKEKFEKELSDIQRSADDAYNAAVIGGGLSESEASRLRIEAIDAEIRVWERKKETIEELGITEEDYNSKMLALNAERSQEVIQSLERERQMRIEASTATINGLTAIGNALSESIEDEKKRVGVQQGLAMVQVLLNEGIAISEVIKQGSKIPFPLNLAAIATSVATVASTMISSISSINKAKAYKFGTSSHTGGDAIVVEDGRPEMIETPAGERFIVTEPTYFKDMEIGTKVIPFNKLNQNDMNETNNLLKELNNKPTAVINMSDKVTSYINTKLGRIHIINKKFKF